MSENFATTPSPEAMETLIRRIIKGTYTHLPALITSFNPVTQIAKVIPVVQATKNIDNKISFENLPELIEVPVLFCHGKSKGFSMTYPVDLGDECLLSFSMKGFDNWHDTGEISRAVEPIASRSHNISDAIAFVGLSSRPNVIQNFQNDCIEIRNKARDSRVSVYDDRVEIISGGSSLILNAAGDIVATPASGIFKVIGAIEATEDITADSDGTAITVLTHVHPINGGSSAPGPTGVGQ